MKKMKKFLALALAFVVVVTLLPVTGKEVKAANSVEWTAPSSYTATENPEAFDVGDLSVDFLSQAHDVDGKKTWSSSNFGGISYLTGGNNPRSSTTKTSYPDEGAAPVCGTAIKITTSKKGECSVSVLVSAKATSAKTLYVTKFKSGELTNGSKLYEETCTEKKYVDHTFDVELGYDYYVYVGGSKAGYKSITFTPAAEEPEVPLVSSKGRSYRSASLEDNYGNAVRFRSELNKSSSNFKSIKEYGTLVAIQDTLSEGAVLKVDDEKSSKVMSSKTFYDDDDVRQYTLVVTNIPDGKKDSVIVARPYVILEDGTVLYGEQKSGSWNQIKDAVEFK